MGLGVKSAVTFTTLQAEKVPVSDCPRWAVLGRSNVGKSSLLNSLVHPKKMFRTGGKPGVTTGLVGAKIQLGKSEESNLEIVDLPGFGYAKYSKNILSGWEELIISLRKKSEDRGLLWVWLADPKRKPSEEEKSLISWLNMSPFMFVFTKSDQIKASKRKECLKNWSEYIDRSTEGPYWVSSMKGEGFNELQKSARNYVRMCSESEKDDKL